MLQSLLAERFRLLVHRETKQAVSYSLVLAKSGSKLKEAAQDQQERAGGYGKSERGKTDCIAGVTNQGACEHARQYAGQSGRG